VQDGRTTTVRSCAGLAILGAIAVTAFLVRAARTAVVGLPLTAITNVFMSAASGSAAFVQPGLGRAHLNGVDGMAAINADTAYGPAFFTTALTSTFSLIVSAVVLGTAVARSSRRLRWDGAAYAVLIPAFSLVRFPPPAGTAVRRLGAGRGDCRARHPAAPHHRAGRGEIRTTVLRPGAGSVGWDGVNVGRRWPASGGWVSARSRVGREPRPMSPMSGRSMPYDPKNSTPAAISMIRTAATSQSTAAQNGGHHLVLATNWRRSCQ
jgi:hypothetical protein